MKKPKRPQKPKLPSALKRPVKFLHKKTVEERVSDAISTVPRITNETVSDHREEVLSSARKYIYPLRQSRHRVVRLSVAIFIAVVVVFVVGCSVALYSLQSSSTFLYDVTVVIPFPVAKVGSNWVSYESYLFELRHDVHYYRTQQHVDFSSQSGRVQLTHLKQEAMNDVIQAAEVKQLASKYHVTVTDTEVNDQVNLLRSENRLGSSENVFNNVLNEVYGWDLNDFKRELKQQLLQQAVVSKLDSAADQKAQAALQQINHGVSFATVASQDSDDLSTKANGGVYPNPIAINDSNISPIVTAELFKLKPGQVSGILNTGYTLEIVKALSTSSSGVDAAHIQFNLQNISVYTRQVQSKERIHKYISV